MVDIKQDKKANFMQPEAQDTMKKREQFAVSLRKQKKNEIIKQKRMRLMANIQQLNQGNSQFTLLQSQQAVQDTEYMGHPSFKNKEGQELLQKCTDEIGPEFQVRKANVVQGIRYALSSLEQFQKFSPLHLVALLTQIRKLLVVNNDPQTFSDVVQHTRVLHILCSLLQLDQQLVRQEAFYVKTEALWILTNLACTEEQSIQFILQSNLDQDFSSDNLNLQTIQDDVKFRKSAILGAIDSVLRNEFQNKTTKNFQLIHVTNQALGNIVYSGKKYATKVLNETCLMECLRCMLEAEEIWSSDFLNQICWIISQICDNEALSIFQIECCFRIAITGLSESDSTTKMISSKALATMLVNRESMLGKYLTKQCIKTMVELSSEKDISVAAQAVRFLAESFVQSSQSFAVTEAVNYDVLTNFMHILQNRMSQELHKETLWALSNIAAGVAHEAELLLDHTELVRCLLGILENDYSSFTIKEEALWVMANLMGQISSQRLKAFVLEYQSDLLTPVIDTLKRLEVKKTDLILNVLSCIEEVLRLNCQFEVDDKDCMKVLVEQSGGLEVLNTFTTIVIEDGVYVKARGLIDQYYPGYGDDNAGLMDISNQHGYQPEQQNPYDVRKNSNDGIRNDSNLQFMI